MLEGLGTNYKSAPSGLLVPSSVWNNTLKAVDVTLEMVGPGDSSKVLVGTNPPTWAAVTAGGGASAADTAGWLPLTTVVGGVPDLVWDASDNLIPTFTTF